MSERKNEVRQIKGLQSPQTRKLMGYVYPVSPPNINLVALRHLVCSMLFSYLSCALCTNDSLRDEIHIHLQWMRKPQAHTEELVTLSDFVSHGS